MRASPEFELIERVQAALLAAGMKPGGSLVGTADDAAAVPDGDGVRVTSVDLCVEGVHFSAAFSDEQVGHKALAAALSDLAAMGARPREAYVGLIAPPGFDADRAVAIATGIGALAARHGVSVLGGDVSSGAQLALSVTVVGFCESAGDLVSRRGALPGDAVLISGRLGGASAGLALLADPSLGSDLPAKIAEALRLRQLAPEPRIELGAALAGLGAGAMADVSDGVLADAEQIARASEVAIEIWPAKLPIAEGVAEIAAAAGRDPLELAGGGEDYELLVTIASGLVPESIEASAAIGVQLSQIGVVGEGEGVSSGGGGGSLGRGFDHLDRR